jgi:CDP-diacylglycerol---serine O-phosphatidyltransferase
VSNLPLMALKFKDYTLKNNLPKVLLLGIAVITIPFLKWLSITFIFIAYIILSLLFKNKQTT